MAERDYDSTIARMAGNIAAGFVSNSAENCLKYATQEQVTDWARNVSQWSVAIAVEIVRLCKEASANEQAERKAAR